jgi:hypothetical protein
MTVSKYTILSQEQPILLIILYVKVSKYSPVDANAEQFALHDEYPLDHTVSVNNKMRQAVLIQPHDHAVLIHVKQLRLHMTTKNMIKPETAITTAQVAGTKSIRRQKFITRIW